MNQTPDVERELRLLMRDRVRQLTPPVEVFDRVRRRHRRSRQRAVLASALAVVAVVAAVPVVLRLPLGRTGHQVPATRGSLAGDTALIDAARTLAIRQVFTGMAEMDEDLVTVPFAEQQDGYAVLLVVGQRRRDNAYASVFIGRAPGSSGLILMNRSAGPSYPATDIRYARQYVAPQSLILTVYFRSPTGALGRPFGVVIAPPGDHVTISRGGTVGAGCQRADARTEQLPLRDGTALFSYNPDDRPYVRILDRRNRQLAALPLRTARRPDGPSAHEIAAALRSGFRSRLTDWQLTNAALTLRGGYLVNPGVNEPPAGYLGLWAGAVPGRVAIEGAGPGVAYLVGARYRSGAIVLLGLTSGPNHNSVDLWAGGCVPAGKLDHLVLASRLRNWPTQPLVVVGPPAAVRAEAVFADSTVAEVPLTGGGGLLARPGEVTEVRAYDRDGQLIGTGRPDHGLVPVPVKAG